MFRMFQKLPLAARFVASLFLFGIISAVGEQGLVYALTGAHHVDTPAAALATAGSNREVSFDYTVMGGFTKPEWKVALLNSTANYKDPTNVTVCVVKASVPGFDDPRSLAGKTFTVTGIVTSYKGKDGAEKQEVKITDPKKIVAK